MLTASLWAAPYQPWSLALRSGASRALDPDHPNGLAFWDAQLDHRVGPQLAVGGSFLIERPFDSFEDFALPRLSLWGSYYPEEGSPFHFNASGMLVDLHRWSRDGHQIRFPLSAVWEKTAGEIALTAKGTVFLQHNKFTTRAGGTALPWVGFQEKLEVAWTPRPLRIQASLLIEQHVARGRWKNYWGTREAVSVAPVSGTWLGVEHEILTSAVDESTGAGRSAALYDERRSRIGAFLAVAL